MLPLQLRVMVLVMLVTVLVVVEVAALAVTDQLPCLLASLQAHQLEGSADTQPLCRLPRCC